MLGKFSLQLQQGKEGVFRKKIHPSFSADGEEALLAPAGSLGSSV